MVDEFKEKTNIRLGINPYVIRLEEGSSGANYIYVKRDTGKSWEDCTTKEIFELVVDGLRFRELKRAEKIKKELSQ